MCEFHIGPVVLYFGFILIAFLFMGSPLIYAYFYDRTVRQVDIRDIEKGSPLWRNLEERDMIRGWTWVDWRGHRATPIGEYGGYVL